MSIYSLSCNDRVVNWLNRVNTQYDKATPEKVQAADSERAKQTLESNTIYNLFFSSRPMLYTSPQPASRGWFSSGDTTTNTNSHNTTHIHHTHVYKNPVDSSDFKDESAKDSEDASKKKTKEEKTDWKGIAAIGIVSTAVAGISIFVYARLSKAVEGARNYLENTTRIKNWSETSAFSDPKTTQTTQQINRIAEVQLKIDQRAVDKITSSKYSILTFLVGTLAMAGGGITILTSAPALATAGTTALIAGGALMSIAVMHEAYNRGMHWSDEEDGKKEFAEVKPLISKLITALSTTEQPPAYSPTQQGEASYSYGSGHSAPFESMPPPPPTYEASQAIYNQRANPGIYPNLEGFDPFAPTAPTYDQLSTKVQ